jgi:hypothetical protein
VGFLHALLPKSADRSVLSKSRAAGCCGALGLDFIARHLLFRLGHGKRLESGLGPEERGGLVCSSHDQAAGDGLDVSGHW